MIFAVWRFQWLAVMWHKIWSEMDLPLQALTHQNPFLKTIRKTPSPFLLFSATVGSEMEVFVIFCDFPKVLYCQPSQLDDKFHQLTEQIQDHCNSDSAVVLNINDVSIGDVILAQYSEDMSWYRARVKETTKNSVMVLFVDFGNCEETKTLHEISADFSSLPAQAVPCTLLN